VANVPFQAFVDSSHEGIVDRHCTMRAEPHVKVESAAPSGSSRLHCSMNFGAELINNFN